MSLFVCNNLDGKLQAKMAEAVIRPSPGLVRLVQVTRLIKGLA